MSRSDIQRLADIREAGAELAIVVELGHEAFIAGSINRRAAERLLEIIGEAVSRLTDELTSQHPDVPWRDISALRVLLTHHYHRIDPEQVWVIAAEHVPAQLAAVSAH